MVNGCTESWFGCSLTADDVEMLGIDIGNCSCQQIVECLAQLVGLRCWCRFWKTQHVLLEIAADSITALTMLDILKASSPAISLISREIALEMGDCAFRPAVRTHLPGVCINLADVFSRRGQVDNAFVLPPCLANIDETLVPRRDKHYYLTSDRDCRFAIG